MAVPTNTFQTYSTNGIREDIADTVFNISPTETPFMSSIGKGKAKNTYVEWQIDNLDTATESNAVIEGDDSTADAASSTTRVGNYTQLMDKVVQVSSTNQAVKAAGRKGELMYQVAKRGKELKRDIESMALGKTGSATGSASVARESAGVGAWLETNVDGTGTAGGFSGTTVSDYTDGAARSLTETMFKDVVASCWAEGGNPTLVMANAAQKQAISGFSGIATLYRETSMEKDKASILGAADVYISDFGEHQVVANRFMPTDCVYAIDPDYWELRYLQELSSRELSKTGHSDRRLLCVEVSLCAKNEKSSGGVFDLN